VATSFDPSSSRRAVGLSRIVLDLDTGFSGWSSTASLLLCVGLVFLLGVVDALTGWDLALFYLPPIVLATWRSGKRAGFVVALLSAVVWLVAEMSVGTYPLMLYGNTAVRLGFFLLALVFVGDVKEKLRLAQDLATTDPLTKLANSRTFYRLAEAEIARVQGSRKPITVAYIDLDYLKLVNDRHGHGEGDRVLWVTAETMQRHVGDGGTIARLGGDEFVVLLPETSKQDGCRVLSRLHGLLNEAMDKEGYPITFSIGAVTFNHPPVSVKDMIRRADNLMYQVKRRGKNNLRHEFVD
jgi:diguanylate cyclase (GGDEF)-like protein